VDVVFSEGVKLRAEMDNQTAKAMLLLNGGGAAALLSFLSSVLNGKVPQLGLPIVVAAFLMCLGLLAAVAHNINRRKCSLEYENYWSKGAQPPSKPIVCARSERLLTASMAMFLAAITLLAIWSGYILWSLPPMPQTWTIYPPMTMPE
jgi:hypothetical protein